MKIVATADLHGNLPDIPPCELLIIAGDIGPPTKEYHTMPWIAANWLQGVFAPWLRSQPARRIVGIAGNHDLVASYAPGLFMDLPWMYLDRQQEYVSQHHIFGSPWTPWFNDWGFNMPRDDGGDFAQHHWDLIDESVDIVVTHGPPRGILDKNKDGERVGCPHLLGAIKKVRPKLHIFGHVHEGFGQHKKDGTLFVNASFVNERYKPVNGVLELNVK